MADKKNIVIRVNYPKQGNKSEKRLSAPELITEWHVKRIVLAVVALGLLCALPFFVIQHEDQNPAASNSAPIIKKDEASANAGKQRAGNAAPEQMASIPPVTAEKESAQAEPLPEMAPAVKSIVKSDNKIASIKAKEAAKDPTLIKNKETINNIPYSMDEKWVSRALFTTGVNNKEPIDEVTPPVKIGNKKTRVLYYFTELKKSKERALYHEWLRNGKVVAKRQLYIGDDRWRTSSKMKFSNRNKGNWMVRLVDKSGRVLNEKKFSVVLDE